MNKQEVMDKVKKLMQDEQFWRLSSGTKGFR